MFAWFKFPNGHGLSKGALINRRKEQHLIITVAAGNYSLIKPAEHTDWDTVWVSVYGAIYWVISGKLLSAGPLMWPSGVKIRHVLWTKLLHTTNRTLQTLVFYNRGIKQVLIFWFIHFVCISIKTFNMSLTWPMVTCDLWRPQPIVFSCCHCL